ncbi:MAG: hypothetical protein QOI41_4034, partial [Myxococcales bacterium]|nr:hypothetical protein [Myxococcales bacterium]
MAPGHCVPPLGPSCSAHRQPSAVGPQSKARHEQRRPGAGQPVGAQQTVLGNAVSLHTVSLGVSETRHVHVWPRPNAGTEHCVMLLVG